MVRTTQERICMIRSLFSLILIAFSFGVLYAQPKDTCLYDPGINAMVQIDQAISQAAKESKHVLIQVGGNWCPWCIKLHQFIEQHQTLDSLIRADYILIHVNCSKDNKNPEAMSRLEFPQRFGFPVFVILNAEGKRLHTQNTAYLEEGELYSEVKFAEFLKAWNRNALDPTRYSIE